MFASDARTFGVVNYGRKRYGGGMSGSQSL